ncbi:MAG: hypothetical protein J6033_02740 [Lachnospiraceae bacterium]|nr:hypothetical protein [Lachnospiraceae bacterium]
MILINMEMPEKCGLCPLFHAEHPMHCQGVKADRKKKIVAPYGQPRPDWCPLHEVDDMPTVFQTMNQQEHKSLVEWKEDFKGFVECLDIPRDDYKGIMAYIDEVPSAERTGILQLCQPVGIGIMRWKCSVCGEVYEKPVNYCSHCGFKLIRQR